jgi:hypothetical protein
MEEDDAVDEEARWSWGRVFSAVERRTQAMSARLSGRELGWEYT